MQNLVAETPICLLDVDGKKILQRNIEIFNSLGLNNINVVAGYLKDKINLPGINKIENDAYETTHILHSIMSASDKMNGKTLIAYSDLLFEKEVVEKLLKSDADITLVVDSSMKTSPFRSEKLEEKDVVLVEATHAPIVGDKVVRPERENHILKIGKRISKDSATHEYVGMALFSEKGMQDFKKAYSEAKEKYQEGEFHEASNFSKANFFHLLQEMINNGYKVNSLEIEKGWMEVHTFEDYKRACQMLSR
jgi:phosphoenolpyruvate phosphomutase